YELAKWSPPRHELHEYLGPTYSRQEITTAVNRIDLPVACPDQLETTIARCIANGHIVARFAGQAEFGPRALGNRSILCDPRRLDMKDYLNAKVKHREAFRPFAPSVLEEHARDWFDFDDRNACAYMLRVVMVRAEKRDQIPAVLHMDHTARIQSLT